MKLLYLAALSSAGIACRICRARRHPSGAEAGPEQNGDRLLLLGRSVARQPRGRRGHASDIRPRLRKRCGLLPRRQDARLHRRIRRQRRRLHRPGHRRSSQAPDVSPRCRPRCRLDPGRHAHTFPLQSAEPVAIHPTLHGCGRRRPSRSAAAADGLHGRVFARWQAHGSTRRSTADSSPTGFTNFVAWKRYRGGSASYLWIVNLADLSTQSRCRAPIPTTSIRCGSATRSTSSPTATAR